MTLGEDLVHVSALLRINRVESEIVNDEEVDGDELPKLGVEAVVESHVAQCLQHPIGTESEDGVAAMTCDVTASVRDEGLANTDRADDGDVRAGLEEAETDELVEERLVVGNSCGRIPSL